MVPNEMYRETANYLVESGALQRENVVLLQFTDDDVWLEYYTANKGEYFVQNYYSSCFVEEINVEFKDGEKIGTTINSTELLEELGVYEVVYLFYDHPAGVNMNDNYLYNYLVQECDLELVYHNLYKFTKKL
jgi:hypothetical protein